MTIGVISDTHGRLRPEAIAELEGADLILHAGDVGGAGVLDGLRKLAPVHAVRGNVDAGDWGMALPEELVVEAGGVRILMLHRIAMLSPDALDGIDVVIYGHSHRSSVEHRDGVLYLNPGGAGPRRFRLPLSVAVLRVEDGNIEVEIRPVEPE